MSSLPSELVHIILRDSPHEFLCANKELSTLAKPLFYQSLPFFTIIKSDNIRLIHESYTRNKTVSVDPSSILKLKHSLLYVASILEAICVRNYGNGRNLSKVEWKKRWEVVAATILLDINVRIHEPNHTVRVDTMELYSMIVPLPPKDQLLYYLSIPECKHIWIKPRSKESTNILKECGYG